MHSEMNDPDTYHFHWFLCHEGFAQNLRQENEPPGIIFAYLPYFQPDRVAFKISRPHHDPASRGTCWGTNFKIGFYLVIIFPLCNDCADFLGETLVNLFRRIPLWPDFFFFLFSEYCG